MLRLALSRASVTAIGRVAAAHAAAQTTRVLGPLGACAASSSGAAGFKAADLEVVRTKTPKTKLEYPKLVFGHTFTDHMLEIDYDAAKNGWQAPRIVPYGPLSLDPSAICFHYGIECFEGMKAYYAVDGSVRLFRPEKNMARLNISSQRLALPSFDEAELLACIKALVKTDKAWIPNQAGYSLYLRPTHIGTQTTLGVGASSKSKLFVILSPVGPYYKSGFAPVKLLADDAHVRAWPGGIGYTKAGGNYAPTIHPQKMAAQKGYNQILWLFGPEHYVTEVGTMNMFALWKRKDGQTELITAPLDGTILPGVTRDSIIELVRQHMPHITVTEAPFTLPQLLDARKDGRLIECFGAGTAAIVSPIELICYKGVDYSIPINAQLKAGELTHKLAEMLMAIQYGREPKNHPWSVVVN